MLALGSVHDAEADLAERSKIGDKGVARLHGMGPNEWHDSHKWASSDCSFGQLTARIMARNPVLVGFWSSLLQVGVLG